MLPTSPASRDIGLYEASRHLKGLLLWKTIPTIFSTHASASSFPFLNGLRSISMFWLILHHTKVWLFVNEVPNNTQTKEDMLSQPSSITLTNAVLVIDSFLFLSGTLTSYLTLRQMQRIKGRFPLFAYYVHRIIRILPTYMFILFVYWLLLPYLLTGQCGIATLTQEELTARDSGGLISSLLTTYTPGSCRMSACFGAGFLLLVCSFIL